VRHDVGVGNEEQNDGQQPQKHVCVARLHSGSEEFRNDDDKNLRECEIDYPELAAQGGAVRFDLGFGL